MEAIRKLIERVTDHASGGLIALASERSVEVRFSAPALDHYRKYDVVRAADAAPHERITLQGLAQLERLGKLQDGEIRLQDAMGAQRFGARTARCGLSATISVRDPEFPAPTEDAERRC